MSKVKFALQGTSDTNRDNDTNMRTTFYTILFCGLFGFTYAQDKDIAKVDKQYEKYSYDRAAEGMEDLGAETADMKRKLAESYLNTDQYKQAERVYLQLVETDSPTADDLRQYAEVLMLNKKYKMANQVMHTFYELSPDDQRAKHFHANPMYHEALLKDKGQFSVKNLDINTAQEDFGTSFYKDKLVFASSREGIKPVRRKWNWNRLPFLDTYVAPRTSDGLGMPSPFQSRANKKYHDGPVAFDEKGEYMVLTRNNYSGTDKNGVRKLKLFIREKEGEDWGELSPFRFNNDEYSYGHATLTADGLTMYLASDMPGGYGGVDIYKSTRDKGGEWSKPVNLGPEVNTEGDEMFPFIHNSEVLFFASDGHPGLGGLDVFATQLSARGEPGAIQNLGNPLNSNLDDFALILDKEMERGYFSSNRDDGKGDDDIYSFDLLKPISFGKRLEGIAMDAEGNPLSNVVVSLLDESGEEISAVVTEADGDYSFVVDPDSEYHLNGQLSDYFDGNTDADTHGDEDLIKADLMLEKDPGFSLLGLISDKDTKAALEGVKVTMTNNLGGPTSEFTTSSAGNFRSPLKGKKLNDRITYNIKLEKEGYLSKTVTYNKLLDRPGQYDVHADLNLDMTKLEVGLDIGKAIDINPIYFDLNKFNIRPDAAAELQKIVNVMNEYPNMVIELGSHTDCRASEAYNMSLSDKRAKASAEWVQKRIVDPQRIYGKGYGESQLVNHCACDRRDPGNKICSEAEHEKNRRTEFRIVKM